VITGRGANKRLIRQSGSGDRDDRREALLRQRGQRPIRDRELSGRSGTGVNIWMHEDNQDYPLKTARSRNARCRPEVGALLPGECAPVDCPISAPSWTTRLPLFPPAGSRCPGQIADDGRSSRLADLRAIHLLPAGENGAGNLSGPEVLSGIFIRAWALSARSRKTVPAADLEPSASRMSRQSQTAERACGAEPADPAAQDIVYQRCGAVSDGWRIRQAEPASLPESAESRAVPVRGIFGSRPRAACGQHWRADELRSDGPIALVSCCS